MANGFEGELFTNAQQIVSAFSDHTLTKEDVKALIDSQTHEVATEVELLRAQLKAAKDELEAVKAAYSDLNHLYREECDLRGEIDMQLDTVTRQRDIAVKALERIPEVEWWEDARSVVAEALAAIQQSKGEV